MPIKCKCAVYLYRNKRIAHAEHRAQHTRSHTPPWMERQLHWQARNDRTRHNIQPNAKRMNKEKIQHQRNSARLALTHIQQQQLHYTQKLERESNSSAIIVLGLLKIVWHSTPSRSCRQNWSFLRRFCRFFFLSLSTRGKIGVYLFIIFCGLKKEIRNCKELKFRVNIGIHARNDMRAVSCER